jgi:hypothetical protein
MKAWKDRICHKNDEEYIWVSGKRWVCNSSPHYNWLKRVWQQVLSVQIRIGENSDAFLLMWTCNYSVNKFNWAGIHTFTF